MADSIHTAGGIFKLLHRLNIFHWLSRAIFGARITSVAGLTIKAAVRFKLFPVLAAILLLIIFGLPAVIKEDGTARGLTQILITYTLGLITVVLGLSTLWLACGTLARDVEECQMQVVAVKPIARWQIWLGKWVGLMALNAMLLGFSGLVVHELLLRRAAKLPAPQQTILKNEVLIGRGSFKPPPPDVDEIVRENVAQIMQRADRPVADRKAIEDTVREQVKAMLQAVPPRGMRKRWVFDLGIFKNQLRDLPLYLRIKFVTSEARSATANPKTYPMIWMVGPPETSKVGRMNAVLPSETFHEFPLPPNVYDDQGLLTVDCINMSGDLALLFPLEDGIELLYKESGFSLNFARGLFIIYLWLALLAVVGLTAASFLSFPVAAFLSLSVLLVALASGTLSTAVKEGTVGSSSSGNDKPAVDRVLLPLFSGLVAFVNLAQDFSPIDSLSAGRSVTWTQVGKAFAQIMLVLGGLIGAFGIWTFSRRELATAQGQQ
jgi:hypothetical protein